MVFGKWFLGLLAILAWYLGSLKKKHGGADIKLLCFSGRWEKPVGGFQLPYIR